MRTLTSWDSLQPLVGTTSESGDLDFKATLDPSKGKIEFAKDVAALANVLGGHVLVGVSTDMGGTRCTGFHGIEKDLATEIAKVIEEQVKDRCRPTPILNVRSFSLPASPKVVVVVAVDASPLAPVGVLLRQDKGGLLVDKGWAFPYRVGSLTEYLHPDQFGVYASMNARRSAAILNSIPANERQQVCLSWPTRSLPPAGVSVSGSHVVGTIKVHFLCVDLLGNVASFIEPDRQSRSIYRSIRSEPSGAGPTATVTFGRSRFWARFARRTASSGTGPQAELQRVRAEPGAADVTMKVNRRLGDDGR